MPNDTSTDNKLPPKDIPTGSLINREAAIELAQRFFKERSRSSPHMEYAAVDEKNIVESTFAWILPWNGRPFLETGDFRFEICGHSPLVVFMHDGTTMWLPSLTKSEKIRLNSRGFRGTISHRVLCLGEKLGYDHITILSGNGDAY